MEKKPPVRKLEAHIFVCTNERVQGHPRGSCRPRGAEELIQRFKMRIASAGLAARIRTNKAGCLDTCEYGPTVVIYPEGVWYGGVRPDDVDEIVQTHLVGGRPVERLRIPGK